PLNDPSATKPVVLLASGGSFVNQGDLERMEPLCKMLSSYGLIVAAVNYRNVPGAQSDPRLYSEAISKADQDISAAVRYFRKEAATYGVDTAAIFTGGYSSGAIASIAQAYVSYNEIFESQRYLYPEGKYGVQGNPGFNSKSIGLISISGEINSRLSFIEKDDPHFFGVCSLNDPGVTCDSSFSQFGGFAKYGAEAIASYASSIGLISDYYYFTGDDHQITINDPASYESRLLPFIRSVLCKENPPKPPTLYNEAFGTNVLASGVWSTFSLVDDQQNWTWNEELQFMESNNFDSERSPEFMADDWLITPEINLGQFENPMLSFEYALKFDDLEGYGLSVFVAINNDHNDQFDEFDWIPISENNTFSEPTTGANYMDFVDSGKILLHEYAGQNINIAFRYSSSGSGTNTAFRVAIDNVIID
ncbi:MAG: choice-of-anchor J domain-containing protein, partial [Cyclobacteriaceae bacterium]